MAKLVIESWSDDSRWASEGSWNLKAFCGRIERCTQLRGTELKRTARKIMKKELTELDNIEIESSNPLIHTLESLGAKIVII